MPINPEKYFVYSLEAIVQEYAQEFADIGQDLEELLALFTKEIMDTFDEVSNTFSDISFDVVDMSNTILQYSEEIKDDPSITNFIDFFKAKSEKLMMDILNIVVSSKKLILDKINPVLDNNKTLLEKSLKFKNEFNEKVKKLQELAVSFLRGDEGTEKEHDVSSDVSSSLLFMAVANKLEVAVAKNAYPILSEVTTPWKKRHALTSIGLTSLGSSLSSWSYSSALKAEQAGHSSEKHLIYGVVAQIITSVGDEVSRLISERKDKEAKFIKEYANVATSLAQTFGDVEAVPGLESSLVEAAARSRGRLAMYEIVQQVLDEDR